MLPLGTNTLIIAISQVYDINSTERIFAMKKILSVILIAATLLTLFASCGDNGTENKTETSSDNMYEYVALDDKTAKITKFIGTKVTEVDGAYTIPSSIDGYTVTVIGERAFEKVNCLKVVNTPDTLITIEPYAFYGSSITKIFMHRNSIISEIGEYAFADCKNLTQADMPRTLVKLGDYAFQNCEKLKIAYFRGNTKTIGAYSFDACPKVTIYVYDDATNVLSYLDTYPLLKREIKDSPIPD